jgi:hypothetical protein
MSKVLGLNGRVAAFAVLALILQVSRSWAGAGAGIDVWSAGDEYVRLSAIEAEAPVANQHPAQVDVGDLVRGLAALKVHDREADDSTQLFDLATAERLGAALAQAFSLASPQQDVTFAAITTRPTGVLGKRRDSVSARIFLVDEQLNLVFGDLLRSTLPEGFHSDPARQRQIDRRIFPHRPGSRERQIISRYSVQPDSAIGLHSVVPGRTDWVSLDLRTLKASRPPVSGQPAANHAGEDLLESRLRRLKSLHADQLIDEQSYRTLVEEAVRRQLLE